MLLCYSFYLLDSFSFSSMLSTNPIFSIYSWHLWQMYHCHFFSTQIHIHPWVLYDPCRWSICGRFNMYICIYFSLIKSWIIFSLLDSRLAYVIWHMSICLIKYGGSYFVWILVCNPLEDLQISTSPTWNIALRPHYKKVSLDCWREKRFPRQKSTPTVRHVKNTKLLLVWNTWFWGCLLQQTFVN